MSEEAWVHVDVDEILKETEKAFKCRLASGHEEWLPKSQMSNPEDYNEGDRDAVISITSWLASQKEL